MRKILGCRRRGALQRYNTQNKVSRKKKTLASNLWVMCKGEKKKLLKIQRLAVLVHCTANSYQLKLKNFHNHKMLLNVVTIRKPSVTESDAPLFFEF